MRSLGVNVLAGAAVVALGLTAQASVLTPGSLVAIKVGAGATTLSNAAAAVALFELNTTTGTADYDNLPVISGTGVDGPVTSGARYIAVDASGVAPIIYVTSVDGARILKLTDLGTKALSDPTPQTLSIAGDNYSYKGVALIPVPEPTTASVLLAGSGLLMLRRRKA